MAILFLDNFTGSGDLSTHTPDIGAAYTEEVAPISDMVLDGAGRLVMASGDSPYASSVFSAPAITTDWAFEASFRMGSDGGELDIYVGELAVDNWYVEAYVNFDGTTADLEGTVSNGGIPYFDTTAPTITPGATVILRVEHSAAGVQFKLDGTVLLSTTAIIGDAPVDIKFSARTSTGAASPDDVDYIKVEDFVSASAFWTDFVKTTETF